MIKKRYLIIGIIALIVLSVYLYSQIGAEPIKYLTPANEAESCGCGGIVNKHIILFQDGDNETEEDIDEGDVDIDLEDFAGQMIEDIMANPFVFLIIVLSIVLLAILIIGAVFYIRAKHKEASYYSKPRFKNKK